MGEDDKEREDRRRRRTRRKKEGEDRRGRRRENNQVWVCQHTLCQQSNWCLDFSFLLVFPTYFVMPRDMYTFPQRHNKVPHIAYHMVSEWLQSGCQLIVENQ